MEKGNENGTTRAEFLKKTLLAGTAAAFTTGLGLVTSSCKDEKPESGKKVRLLSPEGKIVEVDSSMISPEIPDVPFNIREGAPNKKFVMVIDLAKCKHAGKCKKACSKMHYLPADRSYVKITKIQESEETAPFWMPTTCFHCDNPPCVKVCPVDATFKLSDGTVGIDNDRCIGCRYCMAACPYSARIFNWSEEVFQLTEEREKEIKPHHACSTHKMGTVEKCDFCPSHAKQGLLPDCVTACPNGVFYFGDEEGDSVSNGDEVLRLSTFLRDRAAYRYLEHLGTKPRVYYLPPVNRSFPFNDADGVEKEDA